MSYKQSLDVCVNYIIYKGAFKPLINLSQVT